MARSLWDANFGWSYPGLEHQVDVVVVEDHEEEEAMGAVEAAEDTVATEVGVTEIVVVVATVEDGAVVEVAEDTETGVEVAAVTAVDEEVMTAGRIRGHGIKSFPNLLHWP